MNFTVTSDNYSVPDSREGHDPTGDIGSFIYSRLCPTMQLHQGDLGLWRITFNDSPACLKLS